MFVLMVMLWLELIFFCFAYYYSYKDIMSPSVVMCIMFIISTAIALINYDTWNVKYTIDAAALLLSGILVFIAAEVVFRYLFCGQLRNRFSIYNYYLVEDYTVLSWKLVILISLDMCVCIWYFISIYRLVGGSLAHITNIFHVYRNMKVDSLATSTETMISGTLRFLMKISNASGYVAGYLFINNIVLKNKKKTEQVMLFAIMVLSIMPGIMSAGRTDALRLISSMIIEYYIIWHQKNGWRGGLSLKYICYGIVGFVLVAFAFYYSLGLLGRTTEKGIFAYISHYLGGSIALFDLYVQSPVDRNIIGEESLYSILKVLKYLGIGESSTSYNLEYRSLTVSYGNVYTFFRRPLHDFGIVGMYIFTIIISCLFSWIYYKNIRCRKKLECVNWVLVYGYLFFWIVLSSIDQYSQTYISAGTVIVVIIMLIMFRFLVSENNSRRGIYIRIGIQ